MSVDFHIFANIQSRSDDVLMCQVLNITIFSKIEEVKKGINVTKDRARPP